MTVLKIVFIVVSLLLLFFPLLPLPMKLRKFSTFRKLRYDTPHNRVNAAFILLTILEFVAIAIVYSAIFTLAIKIASVPFIASLLQKFSDTVAFNSNVLFRVLLLNIVTLYAFLILKAIVKGFLNVLFGFTKKKAKKKKKKEAEETTADEKPAKRKKKPNRISYFFRPRRKKKTDEEPSAQDEKPTERVVTAKNEKFKKEHPILFRMYQKFWGLFFEGPDFYHAKRFVSSAVSAIQFFIYLVEILYAILFLLMLLAVFFPLPSFFYGVLNWMTIKTYIYPFVSLLLLQEICNTFRAPCKEIEPVEETYEKEIEEVEQQKKIALDKLRNDILRRFAKNHSIRFFPATDAKEMSEYHVTSEVYQDALTYIGTYMKENYGRVVQSYMSGLDAVFNDRHVYFGSSFYSQLGEYIITYTYIRLLSGQRMIFIVSDRSQVVKLQQYIGNRLTDITGVTREETWRVYSADSHHVNEADVLVGVPEDFATDNLVENYPAFFEEVCNAVFVDADSILNLNSYLCTIMACRLLSATEQKIRFLFLSRDVLQGFSASLRKFFCIDEEIVDCNSAEENENVSYMLWNRECNSLYNKNGQSETTIECLVAEAAYSADVDGIRILTSVPLKPAEKQNFLAHDVEINEFHKKVPRVNYMICTDDRCNLAAAIYAYTRFHGREASIVHILSRPYLLREYFGDRVELYVNRSDLIKPRATEHADTKKLLLLRLVCEATSSPSGIPLSVFTEKVDAIMTERGCAPAFDLSARVAYVLSELMSDPTLIEKTEEEKSDGTLTYYTKAKKPVYTYFIVLQPERKDGYTLKNENGITFLCLERIFDKLLANNRRVELVLHGSVIGTLETFPERVYQQYVPGQYIIFDNHEYEIEKISDDRTVIYLRQENITNNSCLDTAFLRHYEVRRRHDDEHFLHGEKEYSAGQLLKIETVVQNASILGETYGTYRLMADSQTLNFKDLVGGNFRLADSVIKKQARKLDNGRVLTVRLTANEPCDDGVRRLLAAVLNEFLRTMFPETYRCVAVCPVLRTPLSKEKGEAAADFNSRVESLYPYLLCCEDEDGASGTKDNVCEFLIINDAHEDVGILDRLYDGSARIMEEIFSYIYDYLIWLKSKPTLPEGDAHYIYFGSDTLPEVYALDESIALLANCAREFGVLEDEEEVEKPTHCSFCKKPLVTGRYAIYDENRYICFDCQVESISDEDALEKTVSAVEAYWKEAFPLVPLPEGVSFDLADPFSLEEGQDQTEYFYRLHYEDRRVDIECDLPEKSVFAAVLRAYMAVYHRDGNIVTPAAEAQLYFEELRYLDTVGAAERAAYVREQIPDWMAPILDEMRAYVGDGAEGKTSFDYVAENSVPEEPEEIVPTPGDDENGTDNSDALYDPDRVPRFWKRYLRGKQASDDDTDEDALPADAEDGDAADEGAEDVAETGAEDAGAKPKKKGKLSKLKTGEELIPYEAEEKTNPEIRLYNRFARAIADFSDQPIPCEGMSLATVNKIYYLVLYDYPEFFWVENGYRYNHDGKGHVNSLLLSFRCLGSDGKIDVARVQKYRRELRASVKFFTKGITRKTSPYDALLTIYRRLILNLDYDGVGLDGGAGRSVRDEDTLRSLHSALVERKVVCQGYAVAMQYLLQSVGICCGQVVSQTHSWNVVKIDKQCYFLDATWGDNSNTKTGEDYKNVVGYEYFCVPAKENLLGEKAEVRMPDPNIFVGLEEFRATKHEYARFHGGYLTSYDVDQIAAAFAKAATARPFEKERPSVMFRCRDVAVFRMVQDYLFKGRGWQTAMQKAQAIVAEDGKNKRAQKLLSGGISWWYSEKHLTLTIFFTEE